MNQTDARHTLLSTLSARWRPESVVPFIEVLLEGQLTEAEKGWLLIARPRHSWSSMPQDFPKPKYPAKLESTLQRLSTEAAQSPDRTRLVRRINRIGRELSFKQREFAANARLLYLAQFAETSFAPELTQAVMDDGTLSFVAYYTARLGLRSVFTNSKQARPFDELAELLLGHCQTWEAVALVFPRRDVLDRLDREVKLTLLSKSGALLSEIGELLAKTAERGHISADTMIVHKGNDSSTWNALAGAWNRARDFWIACLDSLGWLGMLDLYCPGKVLRLMAADVAVWHGGSDYALHRDTMVWRELPAPWEVLRGNAECTRFMVQAACERHGVDPERSGWTGARDRTVVEQFTPTPELVHGVKVGHPALAVLLRTIGVFSGKGLKLEKVV